MYKSLFFLSLALPLLVAGAAVKPAAPVSYTIDKSYKCKGLGDVDLAHKDVKGPALLCFRPKKAGKPVQWSVEANGKTLAESNGCVAVDIDNHYRQAGPDESKWTDAQIFGFINDGKKGFKGGIDFKVAGNNKTCKLGEFKKPKKGAWVDTDNKVHKGHPKN
ncbi:uncharacterized protein PFL1_00770 [Pseudozyma flocculosa PF-1]|uniref:Uncharacterized protein n=1 Tax=Pseudozyma flocculosa TaxID=84751 RepID=A0A5C3F2R0_9BASI|nr:uncharacterized protein PFL1_00770 [Pseudozyma flocculosa PF-1]EPQ31435.1 hypothetical protein PFL1_00770 [Pseudozyma flocculosa PF-1]SPO38784.1 uncharacterized protein PSFLO_04263 [Pseudozyma flocculosa]